MSEFNNVDHEEIRKFEAIASRWWDLEGEFKPLHEINPLRLQYIESRCGSLHNQRIIDVGCGGGILSESMAKRGANVTGIDMGAEPLQVAKLHSLESQVSIDYLQMTAEEKATQSNEQYDIVTCLEMLEHVPTPLSVVEACARLVKPNGEVFFSTLNKTLKSYLYAILGAEKVLKLVPENTHDHDKFIRPSQLIEWAEQCGLKVIDIIGLHYNPLTKAYRLGKGVDVNYMIYCRKL